MVFPSHYLGIIFTDVKQGERGSTPSTGRLTGRLLTAVFPRLISQTLSMQHIQHSGLTELARPPSAPDPLRLPNFDDQEAWMAMNNFFSSILVPHLLCLEDPERVS